jgi:hypothetical protein
MSAQVRMPSNFSMNALAEFLKPAKFLGRRQAPTVRTFPVAASLIVPV